MNKEYTGTYKVYRVFRVSGRREIIERAYKRGGYTGGKLIP
jgi:hypothetical protein